MSDDLPTCETCQKKIPWPGKCGDCIDLDRLESAQEVPRSDVKDEDYLYNPEIDDFETLEMLLDKCAFDKTEPPEFAFLTRPIRASDENPMRFVESICEDILGDHHDEADLHDFVATNELETSIKAWLEKQTLTSYEADYSKKVRLPSLAEITETFAKPGKDGG